MLFQDRLRFHDYVFDVFLVWSFIRFEVRRGVARLWHWVALIFLLRWILEMGANLFCIHSIVFQGFSHRIPGGVPDKGRRLYLSAVMLSQGPKLHTSLNRDRALALVSDNIVSRTAFFILQDTQVNFIRFVTWTWQKRLFLLNRLLVTLRIIRVRPELRWLTLGQTLAIFFNLISVVLLADNHRFDSGNIAATLRFKIAVRPAAVWIVG